MKKALISRTCLVLSALLTAVFVIKNPIDYATYSSTLKSAPYYVWILANLVHFILPAILLLTVGLILKKKK